MACLRLDIELQVHKVHNGVTTGDLPVYRELVLSLYRKQNNELSGGMHGYWFCNIRNEKNMTTLKNKDLVDEKLAKRIEEIVEA